MTAPPEKRARRATVAVRATGRDAGAIAVIQIVGDAERAIRGISADPLPAIGHVELRDLADVDRGVIARPTNDVALIMPHGGMRVVQRLLSILRDNGITVDTTAAVDPTDLFPEAHDAFEAIMLCNLPALRSPMGLDLLLDQPRRWRRVGTLTAEDRSRARRLNRLFVPPLVVLAGPANVGKSTLSNRLLGRAMSIEADMPGTTRDYTAAPIDLAGLVVHWIDTPGLRAAAETLEARAVELARAVIMRADLLIALTDHEHHWPELPREADLHVQNKCDITRRNDAHVCISAKTGDGIDRLVSTVRQALLPDEDVEHPGPWHFDERLPLG